MKHLTIEHIEKLDKLKLEQYFQECADKLIYIDYANPYPSYKEGYLNLVKEIYAKAKEHGMRDSKDIFSLILLVHIWGESIWQKNEIMQVLEDKNMTSHSKAIYFDLVIDTNLKSKRG